MKKRILALLMTVCMLLGMLAVPAVATEPVCGIAVDKAVINGAGTVTVTVTLPATEELCNNVTTKITFDKTAFALVSVNAQPLEGVTPTITKIETANRNGLLSIANVSVGNELDVSEGYTYTATFSALTTAVVGQSYEFKLSQVKMEKVVGEYNMPESVLTQTLTTVATVSVEILAESITVDEMMELTNGASKKLTTTLRPGNTTEKVTYSSDDENVATVDETGLVTATGLGTTTITARVGALSDTCQITVICPHAFTKKVKNADTLVQDADCDTPATYYYSCQLGDVVVDELTFTDGEALGHAWAETYSKDLQKHWIDCTRDDCDGKKDETVHTDADGKWEVDGQNHVHTCVCGQVIDQTAHTFDQEVEDSKYLASAATCTENAQYYFSCECGAMGTETFKAADTALDHAWADTLSNDETNHWYACTRDNCDGKKDVAAHTDANGRWELDGENHFHTCACGAIFDTAAHNEKGNDSDETYHWTYCDVCGTEGIKIPHNVDTVPWTQTEDGHYQSCGCGIKVNEGPHTLVEEVKHLAQAATCDSYAQYYKFCSVCGYVSTETFEDVEGGMTAHTLSHYEGTAEGHMAFCNACQNTYGELLPHADEENALIQDNNGHHNVCDDCGKSFNAVAHTFNQKVEQEKYEATKATCFADATYYYSCACGAKGTETFEKEGSQLQHSYTNYVSDGNATCTEDGTKTALCDNGCGTEDTVADEGTKLDHSFVNYTYNNDATCGVDGSETAKCERCEVRDTRTAAGTALQHSYTNYVSNNNATCTADGTKTALCDNGCGTEDTVADEGTKLDHSFVNYIYNNNASCGVDGTETAKCERCEASHTKIVAGTALQHSYTNYVSDGNATCTEDGTKTALCDNGCGTRDTVADEGSKLPHDYKTYGYDADGHWQICSCGATTEKVGHTGGTADCVDKAVCSVCEQPYGTVDATNHKTTELRNAKPATEEEEGYTGDLWCTACDKLAKEGETLPKLEHQLTFHEAKEPTCTAEGNVAYYSCANCDKFFADDKAEEVIETVVLEMLDHLYSGTYSYDATHHYHICACGDKTNVAQHTLELVDAKEATTTQTGYTGDKVCSACGYVAEEGKVIPVVKEESKLVVEGLTDTHISQELTNAGMDSAEKITLTLQTVAQNNNYTADNTKVMDVQLVVSTDGGSTWVPATEENFPEDGKITVLLPYPEGTNGKDYDFFVVHMFSSSVNGKIPGTTETPEVKETENGIEVVLTGLSPLSLSWKSAKLPASNPVSGDTAPLMLLVTAIIVSGAALIVLFFKKKRMAQ